MIIIKKMCFLMVLKTTPLKNTKKLKKVENADLHRVRMQNNRNVYYTVLSLILTSLL